MKNSLPLLIRFIGKNLETTILKWILWKRIKTVTDPDNNTNFCRNTIEAQSFYGGLEKVKGKLVNYKKINLKKY